MIDGAKPTIIDVPNPPPRLSARRPLPTKRGLSLEDPCVADVPFDQQDQSSQNKTSSLPSLSEIEASDVPPPSISEIQSKLMKAHEDAHKYKRRMGKYKTRLSRTRKRLQKEKNSSSREKVITSLRPYLSTRAYNFVADQIRLSKTKKKAGYRFTDRTKSFGIQMKGISAKGYRLMRKIFTLPSFTTITNVLDKIKIEVGFHSSVLEALKVMAQSMSDLNKRVVVGFDEITLKANLAYEPRSDVIEGFEDYGGGVRSAALADHASTFMVRGIEDNWKQPFGYFLTNGTMPGEILAPKIQESLRCIFKTGLIPVAIVMDQGSNNQKAAKILGVTVDKPYFMLDDKKIIVFWDVPHLAKVSHRNYKFLLAFLCPKGYSIFVCPGGGLLLKCAEKLSETPITVSGSRFWNFLRAPKQPPK